MDETHGGIFDPAAHRAIPKLSGFYGIQIFIYGREHGVPHFHAKYQGSEIVTRRRWCRGQGGLDPARLVFLDESCAKTNMTRLRGRAPRSQRVHASAPAGHWQSTTMIGSLRLDGTTSCMDIGGATDTEVFRTYVAEVLCPTPRPGDLVIMDNLGPHKSEPPLALIRAPGAEPVFLPAYSPDFNPIEKMWNKIKALLRRAEARTSETLIAAIGAFLIAKNS